MHAGTLVAPAVSRLAPRSRPTNRGTPAAVGNRRRRPLQVLAGSVNTSPFHRSPRTGRPDPIERPRLAG